MTGNRNLFRAVSLTALALSVLFALWGWRVGLFTSEESLRAYVAAWGLMGPLLFVAFQAAQVVVPVIPGGLGCLAGVILFGPLWGFVYNYAGICLGSLAAFSISRNCGRPLLYQLFPRKTIDKYLRWTEEGGRFDRWFAIAIFLPVAPDDFLCYLAGTTRMAWRRYTAVILLGKPFSIALYSLGLTVVYRQLLSLLH